MSTITRPVRRETPENIRECGKQRPIICTITSAGIELRAKGTRRTYLLPYGVAYIHAVRIEVEARKAARKKGRFHA